MWQHRVKYSMLNRFAKMVHYIMLNRVLYRNNILYYKCKKRKTGVRMYHLYMFENMVRKCTENVLIIMITKNMRVAAIRHVLQIMLEKCATCDM